MPNQGERQNFKWRPNDYSSTTLARYDQEAEHWHRAFKNAEAKNRPADYAGAIEAMGLAVSLVISLITLIIMLLVEFVKWLIGEGADVNNERIKKNYKHWEEEIKEEIEKHLK